MNVYHSNSTTNRGTAVAVDRVSASPAGDIALVHLRTAYSLSTYAPLDLTATAKSSGTGTIQGYGLRANATQSDGSTRPPSRSPARAPTPTAVVPSTSPA